MRKFKTGFDAAFLLLSLLLSLILFHGFVGVSIGTVVIVCINGSLISAIDRFMERHFEFYDRFPLRKYF